MRTLYSKEKLDGDTVNSNVMTNASLHEIMVALLPFLDEVGKKRANDLS